MNTQPLPTHIESYEDLLQATAAYPSMHAMLSQIPEDEVDGILLQMLGARVYCYGSETWCIAHNGCYELTHEHNLRYMPSGVRYHLDF